MSYEAWVAKIKEGWKKEEARHIRAKAKLDKAIARGEYKVEGEYKGNNGQMIRIVTKVA